MGGECLNLVGGASRRSHDAVFSHHFCCGRGSHLNAVHHVTWDLFSSLHVPQLCDGQVSTRHEALSVQLMRRAYWILKKHNMNNQ